MYQTKVEVLGREHLAEDIYKIKFYCDKIGQKALPGQFIHLKCGSNRDYILRRPFSIHRLLGGGTFEILFKVVGKGTQFLSQDKLAELDALGPLGRGFTIRDDLKTALVIAGGIGIAPLMFLTDELLRRGVKVYFLLGAETKQKLLYLIDLKRLSRKVFASTDDGSFGHRGLITDLLAEAIEETEVEEIFACGPKEMLKKVTKVVLQEEVKAQVSLEEQMACGVGACFGCVCKVKREGKEVFKRVCTEGPVFQAEELVWED